MVIEDMFNDIDVTNVLEVLKKVGLNKDNVTISWNEFKEFAALVFTPILQDHMHPLGRPKKTTQKSYSAKADLVYDKSIPFAPSQHASYDIMPYRPEPIRGDKPASPYNIMLRMQRGSSCLSTHLEDERHNFRTVNIQRSNCNFSMGPKIPTSLIQEKALDFIKWKTKHVIDGPALEGVDKVYMYVCIHVAAYDCTTTS
jgi:hypothetical protein